MKILIIPDVHARPFWESVVAKYVNEVDKIIFLGDYVDPYQDEGYTRKEAIKTLKDVIEFKSKNEDKVILLLGNHDVHYFIEKFPRSTRFDSSHAYKLREIYNSHVSLFKIAHEEVINEKKYLFTHAGLMNSWINRNKDVIGEPTVDSLNKLLYIKRGILALSDISKYRTWFGEETGSILWSDVREKIEDINTVTNEITPNKDSIVDEYDYQIFGHTLLRTDTPIITDSWACLDCKKAFIIDEENKIQEV